MISRAAFSARTWRLRPAFIVNDAPSENFAFTDIHLKGSDVQPSRLRRYQMRQNQRRFFSVQVRRHDAIVMMTGSKLIL